MSKQIIGWFDSTPAEEPCAQVGCENFSTLNHRECVRFRDLLLKAYPPPAHAYLMIKTEMHDSGMYKCVVSMMEENLPEEEETAIFEWSNKVESCPTTWDGLEALAQGIPLETYLDKKLKALLH